MKQFILITIQLFLSTYVLGNIDPWDADKRQWTPIMIYAYSGQKDKIDSLLDAGISINEQNPRGLTALWVAVMKGDNKIAKFLLNKGANPNFTDTAGASLLMTACMTDNCRLSKLLLDYGALINYSIKGNTALTDAVCFGRPKLLRMLIYHGANVNTKSTIDNETPISLARYLFYKGHVYKRKHRILKRHGAVE